MYLYSDCRNDINKYLELIKNIQYKNIQTLLRLHGTFASGKSKYLSDVDGEYFIRYNDNINDIVEYFKYFIKTIFSNPKFIFVKSISGWDDRFVFPFNILKDGSIIGYDANIIKTRLDNLLKQNIINQEEYDKIVKHVVSKPTLISFEKLKLALEDFQILFWTYDELIAGVKQYRGKEFRLDKTLLYPNFPTILTFLIEFNDNQYVDVDLSIFLYKNLKNSKSNISKNISQSEFDPNIVLLNDVNRTQTTQYVYEGVFKNYAAGKTMKMLKRIRTVLSTYTFDKRNTIDKTPEPGRLPQYRGLIRQTREEILQSYNTSLGMLNQLKNRISDVIFLIDVKDKMQIYQLIVCILKDLLTTSFDDKELIEEINAELKAKKYDKEKLKKLLEELNKKVQKNMNDDALPLLKKIYDKIKHILPFKIVLPPPI